MQTTHALSALRRKRATLAGEIAETQRTLIHQREALAALDATILLFDPHADPTAIAAVRPWRRCLIFRHGEVPRFCTAALRENGGLMPTRQIVRHVMLAKGMDTAGPAASFATARRLRNAVGRLVTRGMVRKVLRHPETWWELAEPES